MSTRTTTPTSRRTSTALLAAALLAPLTVVATAGPATATLEEPALAFTSDRDGDAEVFVRQADGRLRQLTRNRAGDWGADWSPDGRRLAFVSDRDGDPEVWVMAADGTGARQLTRNQALEGEPAWSPDGRWIAFTSTRDGGEAEVYRMRADGTAQVRLTRTAPYVADVGPAWSPGGHYLLFSSNREGFEDFEVVRMRMNGSEPVTLTRTAGSIGDTAPAYSPDGRTIAFTSERGGSGQGIWTMRADGSRARAVVDRPGVDEVFPAWLPDGTALVFGTFGTERRSADLFLVRPDGTGLREVAAAPSEEYDPDPRPGR